ncbi:uncharacterized protein LOC129717563 [Wyeomyia smithii]|uniref:uncharacterized protein LOC129717563 n=1 Tax=Wyeomyia smithii TaxID=174621 RepID=UPI002467B875|nr:uncharacterized protein LOC129717563 [Wyeomyia smithii]
MDTALCSDENVAMHEGLEEKTCRLCCSGEQSDLRLIFPVGTLFNTNKLLLEKIFECTAVQIINEGDDQNALICKACVDKIDDFYTYRQQCQENDDRIRKRVQNSSQVRIKQEKDLHLDITINESIPACEDEFLQEESSQPRLSSYSAANEFHQSSEIEPVSKDGEDSLLQPMTLSSHHTSSSLNHVAITDEITIKGETIVDDDDVYYNSDGEIADMSSPQKQQAASNQTGNQLEVAVGNSNGTSTKSQYRIVMNASNRERLVFQGYLYCRHFTRRDGSIHWRCRLGGCQAAVNLHSDGTITHANTHGHCHPQNGLEDDIGVLEPSAADDEKEAQVDVEASFEHFGEDDTTQEDINDSEPVAVSSDSLQIVPNKKKGETLVHLGFKYCKRYLKMDGSTFWKCRSNNNKCSAGVYVYPDSRVKYHGIHNHEKVVNEGQEGDHDNSIEGDMEQPYTIIEDVEDDDEPEDTDDMAALLTSSVEVMMPADQKQIKKDYEITTNVKGRECLIYEGHQYSKDRERVDGAVFWRCRRNYDKCRAMAIVYNNGKVEKCGEHHHETDKRYLERQEQGTGSRMYRITKNQRGNDALVFDGHRFSKEWSRVNGSIIWRCSYKSGICKMKVVLNADGYVHHMGADHEHDHEKTETPVTEEYAVEEDVEIVEDSLLTPARNQQKPVPTQPSQSCPNFTPEQQAAGGYRIVKNRKGFEALVHDGFRYCKVRVRQDGSVKWLCKMNKKTCRAAVDLFPDGSVVKASEYDHNHERPTDMDTIEDDEEVESSAFETFYPIDPEVFGNSQWYYVKNSKNGISMIHAGYRYTKKCDRVDGTSLWRCSASQRGCKAGVILFPNDTLAMVENAEHSHKPYESVKPSENEGEMVDTKKQKDTNEASELDRTTDENDIAMHSLLQTVLGGEDVPWMGGEMENEPTNESVWFNSAADRPYPRPTGPPNFRIIKNRRNTDSLVHRGYRYCKIRDRQDGSILWACQMNKKTCKASVNLTTDGRVEVINGKHNHQKTDFDDTDERPTENIVDSSSDVEVTSEESAKPPPVTQPSKHPDYYYSVNKSNRECLIHKGYRFCKRSDRPDGSTVWRCSMGGNTCMVVVTVAADGTPEQNSITHNHRPLEELPPAIERATRPTLQPSTTEDSHQTTTYNRQGDNLEWKGFHYRKIKELPDKCIIWICQVDSCRVAVKMLPNNHLKMLSESEHNHTAAGLLSSSSAGSASNKSGAISASSGGKTRSYRLFKNSKGQMTLVFQGYRYSIRNRNQDGSSSWKCRANASCRVVIHLMPDDRIVPENGSSEHNHEPMEASKKLEGGAQTRVNPLYDYLNIIPGVSSQSSQSQQEDIQTNTSQPAQQSTSDSTSYARNVIEHKGYYYRLVVRKKNGREYWRCVHFKNRTCRAALFCRDNGTIVTSSNGKEHSHSGGANAKPLPSMAGSLQNKQMAISSGLLQNRAAVLPSPPQEVSLVRGDEERYIDHGDYVIAKNRKDQNTLIFKDRRYYLSYNRSDGSAVWRCAHRKRYKCYAYVRLRPDGRLLSTGEHEHSHAMNNSGQASVARSVVPEAKETRNYKIVKNRVGNDILIHDSHRFRLNYQRNDGTTHWRCIWARSNHCSAGVYLLINGVLKNAANEAQITHNHPPPGQVKRAIVSKVNTPTNSENPSQAQVHPASSNMEQSRSIPEIDGITDYKFIEEGSNKILICRGYRYWYTWIRKDGSIYYRCSEVKRLQCPMGALLLSNGKLIRANEHCHNHAPSQDEAEEEFLGFPVESQAITVSQSEEPLEQHPPLPIPADGDDDYRIVKTSRGESLIYRGYRYWAKNRLANGIISLCCTRKKIKKCPAMLRLLTNGRIIDPVGAGHTHSPNCEGGSMLELTAPPTLVPVSPVQPIKTAVPKEQIKSKMSPQTTKLPALSFNEESEDEAEQGDESLIGSRRYIFMKSSSQRNFIVFEGFVYDFEHKQHDGCVFYRCKTSEACPASLMLLTNGRVMNLDDSLHMHDKPDLSNLREVGRGSKEFKIVQNKNGSNILVHRGHRYTTPRAKTDGAGIWYCHTYVPSINRRCYVPIELLPNGRVAPVSEKQHHHSAPFKTKQEMSASQSVDTKNSSVIIKTENIVEADSKSDNRMLLLGGHRYTYAHERDDGAVLWKCAKSSCNASMYRLTDGQVVKGPDHNHEKIVTSDSPKSLKRKHAEIDTKPKTSSPIVSGGDSNAASPIKSDTNRKHPYIGQPIVHEGYRYIFYLTRKDGSEHWRCCRRIPLKCRGGVFKQNDGTLVPSNDEGHSHPPEQADCDDALSRSCTMPEDVSQDSIDSQDPEETADSVSYLEDEGSYDYELVDVKGKKRGFYLIHKGAMFVAGHTRRDRARYYRCRTVGCKVAMLLHRNGLLVRTNEHTHDCQNAMKTDDVDKTDADVHDEERVDSANCKRQRLEEEIEEGEELLLISPEKAVEDDHVTNGSDDVVVEVKEEPVDTL